MEIITGTVEQIVFRNNSNGYTVAQVEAEGDLVTVVGNFDHINPGEYLKLSGYFRHHHTYGDQFAVATYSLELPSSIEGITRYLASGVLPGVGEKTARAIVKRFGQETLDILDHDPDRLSEIKGIGKKTLAGIKKVYFEQKEIRQIMIQIQEYGISSNWALKLYQTYKQETIPVLLNQPYQMIEDIRGIGFKIADHIASQIGFDTNSPGRILAGIHYALRECYQQGNTYLREDQLVRGAARLLGVSPAEVEDQLGELIFTGEVKQDLIDEKIVYYPLKLYSAEDNTALLIAQISSFDYGQTKIDLAGEIRKYEQAMDISLDECQVAAIEAAILNGVIVITGGPGTGKTTIINGILRIFCELGLKTVLAAPTGRAAKRMKETTGTEAMTIHRLLEYEYSLDKEFASFLRDETRPLEADAIIIDESSMIDILLMESLLMAIAPGTRLILVGDADQLPAVGPGNVLSDIIKSRAIKVLKLQKIYRQSENSMISLNAHAINQGIYPQIDNDTDFLFLNKNDSDKLLQDILDLVKRKIPQSLGFTDIQDIQVISPMKKGKVGVINLNKELQRVINPPTGQKNQREFGPEIFREGDKVMQVKNNYRLYWEDEAESGQGVYNGDIGILEKINFGPKTFTIVFNDGKVVTYSFDQMEEITHAYAMTVHKSQGSEFPVVIMPIVAGPPLFLNRKLLYTAATRAKKFLILMGNGAVFRQMIKSEATTDRQTNLCGRIIDYISARPQITRV